MRVYLKKLLLELYILDRHTELWCQIFFSWELWSKKFEKYFPWLFHSQNIPFLKYHSLIATSYYISSLYSSYTHCCHSFVSMWPMRMARKKLNNRNNAPFKISESILSPLKHTHTHNTVLHTHMNCLVHIGCVCMLTLEWKLTQKVSFTH